MKEIDLGQSIGILANVGVIAGIIVLIVEISQNEESLYEDRLERDRLRDTVSDYAYPEFVRLVDSEN